MSCSRSISRQVSLDPCPGQSADLAGRDGRLRISAALLWMRAVIVPAALRFQQKWPGVGLTFRSVPFAQGVRLLKAGECDLHCGGCGRRRAAAGVPAPRAAARGHRRHRRPARAPAPVPAAHRARPGAQSHHERDKKLSGLRAGRPLYFGINRQTLCRLRVTGKGPRYAKLGRRIIYDVADLDPGWPRASVALPARNNLISEC